MTMMRRVILAAALVLTAVCLPASAHAQVGDPPGVGVTVEITAPADAGVPALPPPPTEPATSPTEPATSPTEPATLPAPPDLGRTGPGGLQISVVGALTLIAAGTLLRLAGGRQRR